MLRGQVLQEVFPGREGVHFSDHGLERSGSLGVETGRIHHHVIEVADLLGDTPLFIVAGGNLLDQGGQGLDIVVGDFRHGTPHRILRRLGVVLRPMSDGIAGEVIARAGGRIHVGIVDSGRLGRFRSAGGKDRRRGKQEEESFFHIAFPKVFHSAKIRRNMLETRGQVWTIHKRNMMINRYLYCTYMDK